MKLNYDEQADALTIILSAAAVERTEEVDSGTLVDLDRHGSLVAIEVLRPSRTWALEEVADRFHLDDEVRGLLEKLWPESQRYPFERQHETGAGTRRRVPA